MNEPLEPLPADVVEKLASLAPPDAAPALAAAMLTKIHLAAVAATVPWSLPRVPAWVPVATLVAGTVAGVGLERLVLRPVPTAAPVAAAPAPLPEPPPRAAELAGVAAPLPTAPVHQKPRPRPASPPADPTPAPVLSPAPEPAPQPEVPAPAPADRLREERVLIDTARAALRRSPADGLAAIEQHARLFPQGQLAEEREALAVQLLLNLGREGEARARFAAFAKAFPSSALVAALAPSFLTDAGNVGQ